MEAKNKKKVDIEALREAKKEKKKALTGNKIVYK